MSKRLLPLVALLLALVAGGAWFATRSATERESGAFAPGAAESASDGNPASLESPQDVESVPSAAAGGERTPATSPGEPVSEESFSLDDAQWVDVTLAFPPGTPHDETLAVVGYSRVSGTPEHGGGVVELLRHEGARWAVRKTGGRTSVRIPFAADERRGYLLIEGRYLFLPKPVRVNLRRVPRAVTLEPELGAWVSGRCVLPPGHVKRGVEPQTARLTLIGRGGEDPTTDVREGRLDGDLRFELRAVSSQHTWHFTAHLDGLVPYATDSLRFEPGGHEEIEVRFELGGLLAGRVTAPSGDPIADAMVGCDSPFVMYSDITTDEEGRFVLAGLQPREVKLAVVAEGWRPYEGDPIELADGQEVRGLEVVLDQGGFIAGRVVWPDGSPAVGVQVSVADGNSMRAFGEAETETDEHGAFRLTGLEGGPFTVRAESGPDSGRGVFAGLGRVAKGQEMPKRRAQVALVELDTAGLSIVLEPFGIMGVVRDETGAPVKAFQVSASPPSEAMAMLGSSSKLHRSFHDEQGHFELDGVFPGDWEVSVEASGHKPLKEPVLVAVPLERELEITLARLSLVSGTVVDPNGTPIDRASVFVVRDEVVWTGQSQETSVKSRHGGAFSIDVPPPSASLVASHADWADSEPLAVESTPGSQLGDVVLRLRVGGRLTGEVLDENGRPHAAQSVQCARATYFIAMSGDNETRTDSAGRFAFERLTPGTHAVTAIPDALTDPSGFDDPAEMMELFGNMRRATVDVVDGEEVHVVLGYREKQPVRVYGRITAGGVPLRDVFVYVIEEGGSLPLGMKADTVDDEGRYEVTVDRPGAFILGLNDQSMRSWPPFYFDVPDVVELRFDVEMPMTSIAGRVLAPDGSPADGVPVFIEREDGALGVGAMDSSKSTLTESGTFEFRHLEPGTFTLRAGGSRFGLGQSPYGGARVSGVTVGADEAVEGIELSLGMPGKLRGQVRDAEGNGVASAAVFVRDDQGRLVDFLSMCVTDGSGRYSYTGLSAGAYTVFAREATRASGASSEVHVAAGDVAEADLTLQAATRLAVAIVDDDGAVRARVRIADEGGRTVSGMTSIADLEAFVSGGVSSTLARAGPLPPGRYTIYVTALDGRTGEEFVELAGEPEKRIEIRLRD